MITAMDADLLDLARTVDLTVLGARIKSARLARRMTQTAVAGDEMSTAYVSRIESGQRRPDPDLLAIIATRVEVSVDELVLGTTRDTITEARLALVSAEVEMRTGDAHAALRRVDETLMDLAGHGQHALQRETLRLKAAALEATGRLDEAIIMLEDLTESAEPDTLWVGDMMRLSRCYRVTGDLARAIDVGERAATAVKSHGLAGTAEASKLTLSLAATYYERGETGVAARLCRRAIDEAEQHDSSTRGEAYWTASIIESRRGNAEAALKLAHRALAYLEIGQDQRLVASIRSQLGILQLRSEEARPDAALATLEQAGRELDASEAGASVRATNMVATARAYFMLGDHARAAELACDARRLAGAAAPLVVVDAIVLLGQVAMFEGTPAEAEAFYREAILVLSGVGADRYAAELWFELGSQMQLLGSHDQALHAFRRAGAASGLTGINQGVDRTGALGMSVTAATAQTH